VRASVGILDSVIGAPIAPITGMGSWHDASDASTFTFSSSTIVSQWRDKSGNNRHLSQGTVGAQPNRNGTQNGLATVVFDGVDDSLVGSATGMIPIDNFVMHVACMRTGGNATESIPVFLGNAAADGYGVALRASSANVGLLRGGIAWNGSVTPDPAAPCYITLQRVAGTWTVYLNGTRTSAFGNYGAPNTPAASLCIPSTFHQFAGPVYEALFYPTAISDLDRRRNEKYLKTKWGL
jgi:hypothetical protein